jgi:hypothetical protein
MSNIRKTKSDTAAMSVMIGFCWLDRRALSGLAAVAALCTIFFFIVAIIIDLF